MNALIIAVFACMAVASASPSGWGLGVPGAVLASPAASAIVAGPLGSGALLGGAGILGAPGIGLGVPGIGLGASAIGIGAPAIGLGGAGVITNGGGVVGVSAAGATVAGPPTAPVAIVGPSGTVKANGLWGPTLAGVVGKGW